MSHTMNDGYRRHIYVTTVALDRDGIAEDQELVEDVPLDLDGTLVSDGVYTASNGSNIPVGYTIGIYSGDDVGSVIFTVVGTDPDGNDISEEVTGVNADTVFTTKHFHTVTSITPDTTDAMNSVEVGIGDEIATQRIPIEPRTGSFNVGCGVTIPSGTISVTMQLTMDDIYNDSVTKYFINDTTFAAKTATFFSSLGVLCTAVRFVVNSYTDEVSPVFHVIQNKAV